MDSEWPNLNSEILAAESEADRPLVAGRYRLLRSLGSGALGTVFLAQDIQYTEVVAVKVVHPHLLSDPAARREIENETMVARQLDHPHVLKVIGSSVTAAAAYSVTEYAAGGSLADHLQPDPAQPSQPQPLAQVAVYLHQLASALDAAHAVGLIHRDIKLKNILLTDPYTLKLADFSLALDRVGRRLRKAEAWGTPEFAAPEVWDGRVGKASDIYALAVVVYILLTGHSPFAGSSHELEQQHKTTPVPPLRHYASMLSYPPQLDVILAKALAKDPTQRYATAGDFCADFYGALQGTSIVTAHKMKRPGFQLPPTQPAFLKIDAVHPTPHSPAPIAGCVLALILSVAVMVVLIVILNNTLFQPTPKTTGSDNQAQIAVINSFFQAGAAAKVRDMFALIAPTAQAEYTTNYLRDQLTPRLTNYQYTSIGQIKCTANRVCTLTGNFSRQNQNTTTFTIKLIEVNSQWRITAITLNPTP